MGAGPSRMNSLTVIQASQGLAEWLIHHHPNATAAGIVIGHDARHNSQKFAELAGAAFGAKGMKVWWYEHIVHTPLIPFAVVQLGAVAGVMITASHNPAQDNGYKVYGSNGCQINTPADVEIAASILGNLEPMSWGSVDMHPTKQPILTAMKTKYYDTINQVVGFQDAPDDVPRFVYTPMHGVGLEFMREALIKIGMIGSMTIVAEQASPDPDFPTVNFPNPEEKGALDIAITTANKDDICLILANDPDADRLAVAERVGGTWHQFTGDQVGVLIAYYCFQRLEFAEEDEDFMLTTAVSSQMLSCIAAEEGFAVSETLTGFKWLGNRTLELRKENKRVHFAYEEALGYMLPDVVLDKDGIAAAITFLHAVSSWGSPYAMMQQLYQRYGYFETMNTYWKSSEVGVTQQVFDGIRSLGSPAPKAVGNRLVLRWRDLAVGYDSATENHVPELPVSSDSQMITCWLNETSNDQGVRFTIRASGTEPKIKSQSFKMIYVHLLTRAPVYLECRGNDADNARNGATQVLGVIAREWFNHPKLTMEEKYTSF